MMKQTFETSTVNFVVLVKFLFLCTKNNSCLSEESCLLCLALIEALEAIRMH